MIYQVPPRKTAGQAYRACDWVVFNSNLRTLRNIYGLDGYELCLLGIRVLFTWKMQRPEKCLQSVRISLLIKFSVSEDGTAIEAVIDSSRYFVIRIADANSGKHAYVGLGFPERAWAFDMNVSIQDHFRYNFN
jgi:hypothetical protein